MYNERESGDKKMNNIIVVASSNKGKLKEIKEIFKNYDVLSLKEMEDKLKISPRKNALKQLECFLKNL